MSEVRVVDAEALLRGATPGPWEWWTSNSWKRLKHDVPGLRTTVLEPFVAVDKRPDLTVSEGDMALIAAAPDLAARVIAQDAEIVRLQAALTDMRAGWRYIRQHHGDLYGVAWDRAERAADAALAPPSPATMGDEA